MDRMVRLQLACLAIAALGLALPWGDATREVVTDTGTQTVHWIVTPWHTYVTQDPPGQVEVPETATRNLLAGVTMAGAVAIASLAVVARAKGTRRPRTIAAVTAVGALLCTLASVDFWATRQGINEVCGPPGTPGSQFSCSYATYSLQGLILLACWAAIALLVWRNPTSTASGPMPTLPEKPEA